MTFCLNIWLTISLRQMLHSADDKCYIRLMPYHTQWNIGHSPRVFIQFRLELSTPSIFFHLYLELAVHISDSRSLPQLFLGYSEVLIVCPSHCFLAGLVVYLCNFFYLKVTVTKPLTQKYDQQEQILEIRGLTVGRGRHNSRGLMVGRARHSSRDLMVGRARHNSRGLMMGRGRHNSRGLMVGRARHSSRGLMVGRARHHSRGLMGAKTEGPKSGVRFCGGDRNPLPTSWGVWGVL